MNWLTRPVNPKLGRSAVLRAVGGPGCYEGQREEFRIAFETSVGIERFVFSADDAEMIARQLAEGVARYRAGTSSQSLMSSGRPSEAVSTPEDGVNV